MGNHIQKDKLFDSLQLSKMSEYMKMDKKL